MGSQISLRRKSKSPRAVPMGFSLPEGNLLPVGHTQPVLFVTTSQAPSLECFGEKLGASPWLQGWIPQDEWMRVCKDMSGSQPGQHEHAWFCISCCIRTVARLRATTGLLRASVAHCALPLPCVSPAVWGLGQFCCLL